MSKPVRKVRSNGRTIVGYMSSSKSDREIQYESNLEKDFIYILEFDPHVVNIKDQPLSIPYSIGGKEATYTPDFLVEYDNGRKVLFEVKYFIHLEKYSRKLAPKFSAARAFAKKNSLPFKVITELEIRTPYRTSIEYLWQFKTDAVDLRMSQRISNALQERKKCTGHQLLSSIAKNESDYNELIRPLWVMMFHKTIGCNLFEGVSLNSMVWPTSIQQQRFLTYPYRSKKSKN